MSAELQQLVQDVIEVTGAQTPSLYEEDAPVLSDTALREAEDQGFYLVGLIGGKEVGKSALVNALVGKPITESTSFGEGTQIVTAYAHATQVSFLRELLEREVPGRYRIVQHETPRLFRQVLLDLPDIDSHWQEHVEITRKMLRHMLFPMWLQSVEKYADFQPQQMLRKVAAGNAAENFIFCLNKVDQIIEREGPDAGRELRDDYAQRLVKVLNLPTPPRVWMISAIHPDRYDMPQLRDLLGQQKSLEDVEKGKSAAARQQGTSVMDWLARQNLPQQVERLDHLQSDAEDLINERLGSPLLEKSIPGMLDDPAHRLSILDDCLKQRCARWPLVNIIQGVMGPLAAAFRRRLSLDQQRTLESPESLVELYAQPGGKPLPQAIQTTFAQLQQSQPMVSALFRNRKYWEDRQADLAAGELQRTLAETVARQRTIIAQRVCGKSGAPGAFVRFCLTIGALLWFPFLQPVLEAALSETPGMGARKLAHAIVSALSVTFFLKTLTFMILWFMIIWLVVRWDTGRRIERQIARWKVSDRLDPSLSLPGRTLEWLASLTEPIRAARERLEGLVQRAEELKSKLGKAA